MMCDLLEDIEIRLMDELSKGPLTPDEAARRLKVSWATAQGHLLKMVGEGKIRVTRKGRVNVYYVEGKQKLRFPAPSWVRPRSLEEIAEEVADCFPSGVSAAEIIRQERKRL